MYLNLDNWELIMQKPYRGDYKPDYEKWKNVGIKEDKLGIVGWFIVTTIGGYWILPLLFLFLDLWDKFSFKDDIFCNGYFYAGSFLFGILFRIFDSFSKNYDKNLARKRAEDEAERRYQEDLDRWYHYQNAEDEVDDRRLAREIKRKRALSQVDNEQLLDMYGRLSTIQYQTNQQAYLFYQEAQNALARGRTYELENSLDDLERALGV